MNYKEQQKEKKKKIRLKRIRFDIDYYSTIATNKTDEKNQQLIQNRYIGKLIDEKQERGTDYWLSKKLFHMPS